MCAGKTTKNKETVTVVTASTMQYLTQHPDTHEEGNNVLKVCRWSIAAGKRPVPFRTRKLSLHTLMVLQPGGCGRVSHRRHQTTQTQQNTTKKRTAYHRPLLFAFCPPSRPVEGLICKASSMAEGYGGESRGGLTFCLRPPTWQGRPELSMYSRAIELFLLSPHCLSCSSQRFQPRPPRSR